MANIGDVKDIDSQRAHDMAMCEPLDDDRRHGRFRIMLAANIYSIHGECSGVLLDVSQGGAMLNASPPPPEGCKLLLERQNLEVPGTVRWVEGNRFGVQFDEHLTEETLMALVAKSSHPSIRPPTAATEIRALP